MNKTDQDRFMAHVPVGHTPESWAEHLAKRHEWERQLQDFENIGVTTLAEQIVDAIDQAVEAALTDRQENATIALKQIIKEIEKTVGYYQNSINCYIFQDLLVKARNIISKTVGELK